MLKGGCHSQRQVRGIRVRGSGEDPEVEADHRRRLIEGFVELDDGDDDRTDHHDDRGQVVRRGNGRRENQHVRGSDAHEEPAGTDD